MSLPGPGQQGVEESRKQENNIIRIIILHTLQYRDVKSLAFSVNSVAGQLILLCSAPLIFADYCRDELEDPFQSSSVQKDAAVASICT